MCVHYILLCEECLHTDVITCIGHVRSEITTYFQIMHDHSKESISEKSTLLTLISKSL